MRRLPDEGMGMIRRFTFFLLLLAPAALSVAGENGTYQMFPWAPLPALTAFPAYVSDRCREDSRIYIEELGKLTLWAAQMFDSSGKLPTGVLYGATYEYGNYDQCLSVEGEREGELEEQFNKTSIRGQYCLAEITIDPPSEAEGNSSSKPNIWDKAKEAQMDPSALPRTHLHWGVCVPDSCTAVEVQDYLTVALRPFASSLAIGNSSDDTRKPSYSVRLSSSMCTTMPRGDENSDPDSFSGGIALCIIIVIFVAIVIVSSLLELYEIIEKDQSILRQRGIVMKILRCFSAITNIRRLTSRPDKTEPFAFVNGIKVMTLFLIIFGHRFIFNTSSSLSNPEYVETLYHRLDTLMLMGGTVVVDTFLIISGCLLVVLLLGELERNRKLSIVLIFVHRFLRFNRGLIPLYMLAVAFYATIFPLVGDGPTWKKNVGQESEYCAENWWTNLLFINTLVNPERMCMIQSWYIAVDMHLFAIGVPITFLIHRKPKIGKSVLGGITVLSAFVAVAVTYFEELDPILLVYFKTLLNLRENPTFQNSYIQSYMRALPYFLGMTIGYIVHDALKMNIKTPKKLKPPLLLLTLVSTLAAVVGSTVFLNPNYQHYALTAALFNPIHRLLWSVGMGILIFAEATDSSYYT
ncbi:nose resistant to fluoxetine protein 6-like [Hetaerina americana]|uniref:nose resistant to fluoxetine protein 6-like n=1 Tax=Hetaerina americana TaxID=62018 RepID=UPI003A7F6105